MIPMTEQAINDLGALAMILCVGGFPLAIAIIEMIRSR